MNLIPTKKQWKKWTLPTKVGYIGFVLAVVSTLLWCYDKYRNYLDDRKWDPSRRMVLSLVGNTYNALCYSCEYLPPGENHWMARELIQHASSNLALLQAQLIINSRAMDESMLPLLSEFVYDADYLIVRLKYFSEWDLANRQQNDFVSYSPFTNVLQLKEKMDGINRWGIDMLSKAKNVKTPEQINDIWEAWDKNSDSVCLLPHSYKWTAGRVPFVACIPDLTSLALPDEGSLGDGQAMVQVFDRFKRPRE